MNNKMRYFLLFTYAFLIVFALYLIIKFHSETSSESICENCNVILITLDSLRADHVGTYGYKRNTTPNIDSLAQKGSIFLNAVSSAPVTSLSLPAIMSSKLPVQSYIDFQHESLFMSAFVLNESYVTIADQLSSQGYKTAVFYSSPFIRLTGSDKGFMKNKYEINPDKISSDRELRIKAEEFIKESKEEKFFIWIHFQSPHSPYAPPYPLNESFYRDEYYYSHKIATNLSKQQSPDYLGDDKHSIDLDYFISQYDGEIKYIDAEIGMILENLESKNLSSKTLIIISSDHGASFGEHFLYLEHGELYDTNLLVPLIIINPKQEEKNLRIRQQVSTLDIYPTIMDILNIHLDGQELDGNSLTKFHVNDNKNTLSFSIEPYTAYDYKMFEKNYSFARQGFSIRSNTWKYMHLQDGKIELYNLVLDKSEKSNLISWYGIIRFFLGRQQRELIDADMKNSRE